MDTFIPRYCLSLLLLTSIATCAGTNETKNEEPREPRVSGRIVKLYSGAKPEPYLCTGEGFQLDPSNCAAFYRCVKEPSGKFTVFRYQCAPGTVYDPDLETCNHPRSTRRPECGGILNTNPEPHHITNINAIDGAQTEIPRPISTKLPIYAETPTLKDPTTPSGILSTSPTNNASWTSSMNVPPSTLIASTTKSYQSISNNQWLYSTQHQWESHYTSKPPMTTQNSNSKDIEPCNSDGFMGDNINCRKFYRCVGNQKGGYIKFEFTCSESTVWDDETQGCNHPWAVKRSKCGRSMSYDDKFASQKTEETTTITKLTPINEQFGYKSNKTTQQQLQISHGSKVTQTQTQISNSPDVIQNQTQINYGNRIKNNTKSKSKQNQTQISYGTAVSQTQMQIDYGSKGMQTQLQIDHSKDSSQSQIQIAESTTYSTTSGSANNNSKNECSESGFIGDANDCKKFYRCVNNGRGYTKYEYFCGDGTVWDPEIEACNHAWAVKECGTKHPGLDSMTETHTSTPAKSTVSHTNPTKTSPSYTTSQSSDIDDEDDVGYGNQNNQDITSVSTTTLKTTTTTTKLTTQKPSVPSRECKNSGFIGDAKDCKLFYRCVDNGNSGFTKYEFKCGDGTVWDPDIEACNHAWAVKSCSGSTSSDANKEETTTKKENTPSSENVQTTITLVQVSTQTPNLDDDYDTGYGSQNNEPSRTSTSQPPTPPQKQDSNDKSVCQSSGFMGDENDCKKFYRCVDNGNGGYIKYEFRCGQGTVWDPKIDACNHAWDVKECGRRNNTDETSGYETTSQSSSITSSSESSSIKTTQVSKVTDAPMTTVSTASNSTITSGTSNKCSKSGFIGDSYNCKTFYRCVDNGDGSFTRYEFSCGEGTVWDPKIEACNHAWAVDRCGGSEDSVHTQEPQQTTSQLPVIQDEEQENGYVTPHYDISESSQSTVATSSSSAASQTLGETSHCTNSGFMGDKTNCKIFYRCVDNGKGGYDRYEFQCGEGTVWDGNIEACNHAWAVKECGESGTGTTHSQNDNTTQSSSNVSKDGQSQYSTEKSSTTTEAYKESEPAMSDECMQEGFYGDQNDCNKFYRCVDNGKGFTKYDFVCGEGTVWNQTIQGCDHMSPDKSCSSSTSQVVTTQQPTHFNDDVDDQSMYTNKTTTSTEHPKKESTQSTKKPQSSKNTCDSEGFYVNPFDCKQFYRCVANGNGGYTKYDFKCGDGTVWNQEIQACDHESSDKSCSSSSSTQTHATEPQSESTTSSSTTKKTQASTNKTETSESNERQCTSEGFFAHPNDCKKFIRCIDNGNGGYTRYEFFCGDGTVWVQEIQACDHDNNVNSCNAHVGSTTQSSHTQNNSSTFNAASSTESMPLDDEYDTQASEPSHGETDNCSSEGYFGNNEDCKKFYRCVDNGKGGYTKYDFVCGEGTAWDYDLQTCNYINEVQSCLGFTSEENGHHQSTTNRNQAETEGTTPSTTKASTSSGSSSNRKDICKNEGYFGNTKDCKKFYRCVDNGKGGYTKYDFTCGEGTIWDQDITTCNHPQDVSNLSCSTAQGPSETSSTTTAATSSQTISSTTESSSQSISDCSSSKNPANNNVTCDKAGYYANPNDCKKFYRCVDWDGDGKRFSVFHFECGEGTIWDPALDTCNHEDSVYPPRDCSQTHSQNIETTSTEGSTTTTTDSTTSEQTTKESTTSQPTSEQTTTEQSNEPTTTQQSTTQESITSEQTTTQQTTTSEKITTQEFTTTEQATTQQTATSEKTTTQKTTTSEQPTTEETTTSEQTTSQLSITSEQTTTEQTTTSEQTTTQQSTSEKTTTQQSTTNEQTTTEQFTTSEQTTTKQSTTSEQTTTQQSTTSEQTTTQQSTTDEQTTTPQTTISEQTTTEQITTEQSTTEQLSESTTQESSTEQTTTQQSTSSEQTSLPQSTDQTTTQQSTTSEQTTTQQSTDQPTQESTTSKPPTTQESTTSEETTTQQETTSEQTTTEQANISTTEQLSTTIEQTTDGVTEYTTDGSTTTDSTTDGTTIEETTDQSTTQTSSTESDSTEDSSSPTEASSSDKECPETEDDQYLLVCPTSFRRHPKYCNMFYQCTEDDDTYEAKVAMFKCPNNTIYDESKTQCVTKNKADKKCDGEISNTRRFKRLGSNYKEMIVADKGKLSCSSPGYFSFEKQSECAKGFLKCEKSKNGDLRGYVYQCPDGYIYWTISKRCERIESVRDCKLSSNDWTGRWNIPIERKNVATS